ncbi:MAG TPA: hypothetical protein VF574_14975 [Allosphingosinicella sp.]|jgi:hypothetical protein
MSNQSPRKPHPDPEVEALLHFEPVVRKCRRHDGWLHERQIEFIVALTVLGHAEQAAIAVGGTMSGAYKLRTADGGESFAAAWDSALALHHRRHPRPEPKGRPSRGELQSGTGRKAWPAGSAAAPEPRDPEEERRAKEETLDMMLRLYGSKLMEERAARLEGRIVEADFTVRQLSWLEVVFDLGGKAGKVLEMLKRGDHGPLKIVATPMSTLLGSLRRRIWAEKGEVDRPPPPPLGRHDSQASFGEPHWHDPAKDGDYRDWLRRRQEQERIAAEAQREWEEKARAEAAEWARREAAKGDGEGGGGRGEP